MCTWSWRDGNFGGIAPSGRGYVRFASLISAPFIEFLDDVLLVLLWKQEFNAAGKNGMFTLVLDQHADYFNVGSRSLEVLERPHQLGIVSLAYDPDAASYVAAPHGLDEELRGFGLIVIVQLGDDLALHDD